MAESDTPIPENEYGDLLPDEDDPRYGDSSVEPPEGVELELPPLMTGADLLPPEDDPLASLPSEPPDEDTPPDASAPTFINRGDIHGSGKPAIYMADGTPLGVWLDQEHHDLDGYGVKRLLRSMGLADTWPEGPGWYAHHRDKRIEADREIASHPAIVKGVAQEQVRLAQKKAVQEAFVKAQRKKESK